MGSSLSVSKFRSGLVLMAAAAAALTISGCAGNKRPRLAYEERPVEALYNTGYQRLEQRRWADAVDYFQEVERQHPYSDWARRSILMQIYAYYQNNNYTDAIAAADRYIQLFPGNPSAAYAFYMKAVCNFEQITDVDRYKAVIANPEFPRTSHTPEALYRLVEVNLQLGLKEEATRNGAVLGYNFPGSPWYAEAYALLTENGQAPEKAPEAKRESWLQRIIPG